MFLTNQYVKLSENVVGGCAIKKDECSLGSLDKKITTSTFIKILKENYVLPQIYNLIKCMLQECSISEATFCLIA